jgi:opacity protein-like surface antigen
MRTSAALLALALVVTLGAPANAQDPDKPVNVELGAGYTWVLSDAGDVFGDGYNFNFGVLFNASRLVSIEGLYSYNGLGDKTLSIPVSSVPGVEGVPTDFTAHMNMQFGTASVIVHGPNETRVSPYGLTGVGIYYRPVDITTPGVGYVSGYCSPWYYYCVPGGFVPVDEVVADRSSTDFGMVFGGGVNIRVSDAASVFVELRYHYIWGPEINSSQVSTITGTDTIKANGQFMPLTFGVRF